LNYRYCNTFYNLAKKVRREQLNHYNFDCGCDPCRLDWPVVKEMPEAQDFVDQDMVAVLKSLVQRDSKLSGIAIPYCDLINEQSLELAKALQLSYFSPIIRSRLDKLYRLVEMVIYYHWAATTKTYAFI
jgi:hypothetical protein